MPPDTPETSSNPGRKGDDSAYDKQGGHRRTDGIDRVEDFHEAHSREAHSKRVPPELALSRLDLAMARLFPQYSRARLQAWTRAGQVTVDGHGATPRDKVFGGEQITLMIDDADHKTGNPADMAASGISLNAPMNLPLDIIFEDHCLLIVNKPAGLVVHPGAGNPDGTLLNALLHHDPALARVPRAGIVHRLDKNTSGLMVVARNLESHARLVNAIQSRTVTRLYDAVVYGTLQRLRGTIDAPIARHPVNRKLMAIRRDGKPAITHYQVLTRFARHSHIECRLETGRTHQIRVHLRSIKHPLVGDPPYGGHFRQPAHASQQLIDTLRHFPRQALHARQLALAHPRTGDPLTFTAEPPPDIAALLAALAAGD